MKAFPQTFYHIWYVSVICISSGRLAWLFMLIWPVSPSVMQWLSIHVYITLILLYRILIHSSMALASSWPNTVTIRTPICHFVNRWLQFTTAPISSHTLHISSDGWGNLPSFLPVDRQDPKREYLDLVTLLDDHSSPDQVILINE